MPPSNNGIPALMTSLLSTLNDIGTLPDRDPRKPLTENEQKISGLYQAIIGRIDPDLTPNEQLQELKKAALWYINEPKTLTNEQYMAIRKILPAEPQSTSRGYGSSRIIVSRKPDPRPRTGGSKPPSAPSQLKPPPSPTGSSPGITKEPEDL